MFLTYLPEPPRKHLARGPLAEANAPVQAPNKGCKGACTDLEGADLQAPGVAPSWISALLPSLSTLPMETILLAQHSRVVLP